MSRDLLGIEKELYDAILPELRKEIQQFFKINSNIDITDKHSDIILKEIGFYLLSKEEGK